MSVIATTLTREDVLYMLIGTGGPRPHFHRFKRYGKFHNQHWEWEVNMLQGLDIHQLYELYKQIKLFNGL